MLKALARWILRNDAPATEKGRREHFVTPDELSTALQKLEKRIEWELGEWYDKFSALHARAEKRAQREAKKNGNGRVAGGVIEEPAAPQLPSVLAYRRLGSP